MLRPLQWRAAPLREVSSLHLTLTVDGVPCSALEGHVETPPVEGGTATGGKLTVNCSLH